MAGFEVLIATEIGTAHAVLDHLELDAVVCDWVVGSRRGTELLSRVQSEHPWMARLVMSARTPAWNEADVFEVWLTKPCTTGELASALSNALGMPSRSLEDSTQTRTLRRFPGMPGVPDGRTESG